MQADVSYRFEGQAAVVTGAARGIGHAIATALSRAGASVWGFDKAELEAAPFNYRQLDISDPQAVAAAAAALPAAPAMLVNNAGVTRDRTIAKMSDEEWSSVLSVNLTGAFNMLRAIAPRMAANGYGRIVNITSINGMRGKFGQANYAASKAGLIGLTKTAAREFGRAGVTVNAVAPGMVMTAMARTLPPEIIAQAGKEAVLPALAEPDDITHAVLFLLSAASRAITGVVLRVDAGQYI